MNRYRVVVSMKMGVIYDFYINSDCSKAEMLQILAKGSRVINFHDTDDKIRIYPFDSVNYITID